MEINKEKCNICGLCVKDCMSGHIDPANYRIDMDKCIECGHCMAICPNGAITDKGLLSDNMPEQTIDEQDFRYLIYSKRSCRNYRDNDIDKKTLTTMTELLRYSPTGTNSQQVFITVLDSRQKVKDFADRVMIFYRRLFAVLVQYVLVPILVLIFGIRRTKQLFKLKRHFSRYFDEQKDILTHYAPMLILFHCPKKMASTPAADCHIAATTATLHGTTLGLGSCFIGFIVYACNLSRRVKKYIKIPSSHKVYSAVIMGYPSVTYKRGVNRQAAKVTII